MHRTGSRGTLGSLAVLGLVFEQLRFERARSQLEMTIESLEAVAFFLCCFSVPAGGALAVAGSSGHAQEGA